VKRLLLSSALIALLASCTVVEEAGRVIGETDPALGQSIVRGAQATGKAMEDITPEQEYYIGRAVGANLLRQYAPYRNDAANRYLNQLGQTLARFSDRPETYGGYHFLLLDTEEVNAFAAPGGKIFISRGMAKLCRSETDLAAVLAHELGHAQNQHGLRAIKKSRLTGALTTLGAESAKQLGNEQVAELTTAFEGSINDVTGMLVNSGYGRALENEADAVAIIILNRAGYDPRGLSQILHRLEEKEKSPSGGGPGFLRTHPQPRTRIDRVDPVIAATPAVNETPAQLNRFRLFRASL
jgi:beta-barrel assembly-enhancing protease